MLTVVQEKQDIGPAQVVTENLNQLQVGALAQAEHTGDLLWRERRVSEPA